LFSGAIAHAFRFSSNVTVLAGYGILVGLTVLGITRSAIRGAQRFRDYAFGVLLESVARLGLGAVFIVVSATPAGALAGYVAAYAVVFVVTLQQVTRLSARAVAPPRADVTALLSSTAGLALAIAVFQNLDLLLVRGFFPIREAGIYSAGASLARWMALLALPFEALLLPRISFAEGRGASSGQELVSLGAVFLALALIPLSLFAAFPSMIIDRIYGHSYQEAAVLLLPLGVGVFAQYASYLGAQVVVSQGMTYALYEFIAIGIVETTAVALYHDSLLVVALILMSTRCIGIALILATTSLVSRRREGRSR
jgi:O-antigen/teichoic acid export membrane protein